MGRALDRRRARADHRRRRSPKAAQPYRDVRYFYGPAGLYSLAGAFAVFGTSFTTAFAFGLVQAAAILAAFYALARQLLRVVPAGAGDGRSWPRSASPAPPSTSSSRTPTRPPSGILFLLLMLLALSRERLVLAGLAAGVVCLTRPEFAAVAALTGAAFLVGTARDQGLRAALRALPRLALPGARSSPALVLGAPRRRRRRRQPLHREPLAGRLPAHRRLRARRRPGRRSTSQASPSTLARAGIYCVLLAAARRQRRPALPGAQHGRPPARRSGRCAAALAPSLLRLRRLARARASGPEPAARSSTSDPPADRDELAAGARLRRLRACVAVRLLRGERRRSPAPGPSTSPWSPPPRRSAPAPTTPSPPRPPTRPTTRRRWCCCWRSCTSALGERWPQARAASSAPSPPSRSGWPPTPWSASTATTDATVHTPRGSFVTTAGRRAGAAGHARLHRRPHRARRTDPGAARRRRPALHDRPPAGSLRRRCSCPACSTRAPTNCEAIARLEAEHVRYAVDRPAPLQRLRLRTLRRRLQPPLRRWLTRDGASGGHLRRPAAGRRHQPVALLHRLPHRVLNTATAGPFLRSTRWTRPPPTAPCRAHPCPASPRSAA